MKVSIYSGMFRLQVQTHTIALLKAQLEQKNRVIDELKLKKIMEESNTTTDSVEDLKQKLIKCSISVKPKMKCVIGDSAPNSSNSGTYFIINRFNCKIKI